MANTETTQPLYEDCFERAGGCTALRELCEPPERAIYSVAAALWTIAGLLADEYSTKYKIDLGIDAQISALDKTPVKSKQ